jgi:hypothetical protein
VVSRKRQIGTRKSGAKPSAADLLTSRERMSRASGQFLKIDLETALTFLQIARETNDDTRRSRNIRSARKAYETVIKLTRKVQLEDVDIEAINKMLEELKTKLADLGEVS